MSDATNPPSGLTAEERAAIDDLWERRLTATHYDLLGVPRNAERRAIRDAYFALSRRFHPDVFYNREAGPYRSRIDEVFRMLTRAYDVLSNSKQRAGYDLHLSGFDSYRPGAPSERPPAPAAPPTPPTRAEPPSAPPPAISPGAVVPPPVRPSSPSVPVATSDRGSQTVDPAARQRALESMRRRLSSVIPSQSRPSSASSASTPIAPPSQPFAPRPDDRDSKLMRLISDAEEAQKRGDFEVALEHFRGAHQLARDDENVRARMEAVDQLVKAQKTGEHIEKARDAMREGKAELAATLWEKAWEGRPGDAALLVNAAEVLAKYGNNRGKAKELAQRALAVDPKAVKAHVVLAQVFTAAGLKASARAAIEAVERLDPQNPTLKELKEKIGPLSLAEQLGLRGR